ncbi:hypothetical protein ACLKA7_004655 [Drosophila subpalustris]
MDSIRTYEKYLKARIRAERLNVLPSRSRQLALNRHGQNRLLAGGRLGKTLATCSMPSFNCFPHRSGKPSKCNCQDKSESCAAIEPSDKKLKKEITKQKKRAKESAQKKPKHQLRCKCKCKHPVLVVPSKPRVICSSSEDPGLMIRFSKSPLRLSAKKWGKKRPVSCEVEPLKSHQSTHQMEPTIATCSLKEKTEALRHISFEEKARCEECHQIPQISLQLTNLMKKLEDQVASEIQQKEKLNAINDQLMQLSGTVTNLNDKCKFLDTEKEKLVLKKVQDEDKLCQKPSSLCQFCKNKELPILGSLQGELFKLMGKRLFTEVALTILLRADNVYHVNVRDLETGKVLGCLLVNETGIREANCLGLFQEILTFCVIDVRSSMNTRDAVFGGINFEFVSDQRLRGGAACLNRTELFKKLHNPVTNLVIDQECLRPTLPHESIPQPKLTVSQATLQISSISSDLILPDEETKYPIHSMEIVSLVETSSESNEESTK